MKKTSLAERSSDERSLCAETRNLVIFGKPTRADCDDAFADDGSMEIVQRHPAEGPPLTDFRVVRGLA